MASFQIKGIDDDLYRDIKKLAAAENRSVSQQIPFWVKSYLAKKPRCDAVKSPAEVLIALHGSWLDKRGEDQIVDQIKKARKNSRDLAADF